MDSQVSSNLRSRFPDLRLVGFSVLPVHPTASWNEPILTSGKDKRVLVYDEMALQVEAVVLLKLHLPPFSGEGAIYCPRQLRKRDLVAQLGLQALCEEQGEECVCYVNNSELLNSQVSEVDDGAFLWCLHPPSESEQEVELLSIASQSAPSVEEVEGLTGSFYEVPQELIGSAHYCQ